MALVCLALFSVMNQSTSPNTNGTRAACDAPQHREVAMGRCGGGRTHSPPQPPRPLRQRQLPSGKIGLDLLQAAAFDASHDHTPDHSETPDMKQASCTALEVTHDVSLSLNAGPMELQAQSPAAEQASQVTHDMSLSLNAISFELQAQSPAASPAQAASVDVAIDVASSQSDQKAAAAPQAQVTLCPPAPTALLSTPPPLAPPSICAC